MDLKIITRNSGKKALLEACVQWLAQELKIRDNKFSLTLSTQRGLVKNVDSRGMAWINDKKDYTIVIDSQLNFDTMIRTVCHEMVHVKQFVRGQYSSELKRGRVIRYWKGTAYKNAKYHESPWEIEAASKEGLLALKLNGILQECTK